MEDDLNGRLPQLNTITMKDNLNGRRPQWKTTSMEGNLNGRRTQWKMTSMEASQFCTELGPAQPQLFVYPFINTDVHLIDL